MTLANFKYTIVHIRGEDNVWADLLSRWGVHRPSKPAAPTNCALSTLFRAPIAPSLDPALDQWPTIDAISKIQDEALAKDGPRPKLKKKDGVWRTIFDAIWIPSTATHLQLRVCVIGHCGGGGHRGMKTILTTIPDCFEWEAMEEGIKTFCSTCLHFSTIGGHREPRPLAHAMHEDVPNELIHFDYLYLGPSAAGANYVLIIKDDASA